MRPRRASRARRGDSAGTDRSGGSRRRRALDDRDSSGKIGLQHREVYFSAPDGLLDAGSRCLVPSGRDFSCAGCTAGDSPLLRYGSLGAGSRGPRGRVSVAAATSAPAGGSSTTCGSCDGRRQQNSSSSASGQAGRFRLRCCPAPGWWRRSGSLLLGAFHAMMTCVASTFSSTFSGAGSTGIPHLAAAIVSNAINAVGWCPCAARRGCWSCWSRCPSGRNRAG